MNIELDENVKKKFGKIIDFFSELGVGTIDGDKLMNYLISVGMHEKFEKVIKEES